MPDHGHQHDRDIVHNTAQTVAKLEEVVRQLVALNVKEDTVVADIAAVQAAVSKITGDTANVERVLGELNTNITNLQAQIADLQGQIAAGLTTEQQAALQAIADEADAADAKLDSLAPDAPTP